MIVEIPAIESSFSTSYSQGPIGYDSDDTIALNILNEILTATEGILYKELRGSGVAYSCMLHADGESGLLYFHLYRSLNAGQAFRMVRDKIEDIRCGRDKIDEASLSRAKSSFTYSIVEQEETAPSAAKKQFLNVSSETCLPTGSAN